MESPARLNSLSNEQLMSSIASALGEGNRILAELVAYLGEVEERDLHRELGYRSMFDFCTRKLLLSESAAHRRLTAARLARRFPRLLQALSSGRIHLSNLVAMRDLFTDSNVEALIEGAHGKSQREVEAIVARLVPKPDVPSRIRKLPTQPLHNDQGGSARVTGGSTTTLAPQMAVRQTAAAEAEGGSTLSDASPRVESGVEVARANSSPSSTSLASLGLAPSTADAATQSPAAAVPPASSCSESKRKARRNRPMKPLAPARYHVQFTADQELHDMIEYAKALMSNAQWEDDLAPLVKSAFRSLIAEIEKRRFGSGKSPRPLEPNTKDPARITKATRREVAARDGMRCTYVRPDGERCTERAFLEFDHRTPKAMGGTGDAGNVRLLCRGCNQLEARRIFGREHVESAIQFRQRKSSERARARVRAALRERGLRAVDVDAALVAVEKRGWRRPLAELMQDALAAVPSQVTPASAGGAKVPSSGAPYAGPPSTPPRNEEAPRIAHQPEG